MYSVLKDFIDQLFEVIGTVGQDEEVQTRRSKTSSDVRTRKRRSS